MDIRSSSSMKLLSSKKSRSPVSDTFKKILIRLGVLTTSIIIILIHIQNRHQPCSVEHSNCICMNETLAPRSASASRLTKATKNVPLKKVTLKPSLSPPPPVLLTVVNDLNKPNISTKIPFQWKAKESFSTCQRFRFRNKKPKTIANQNLTERSYQSYSLLLVLVHTARSHFERRSLLRQTWGSVKTFQNWEITKIFLIGEKDGREAPQVDEKLEEECSQYKDIVKKSHFTDTYKTLIFKHIMGYEWAARFCSGASFILKSDDDVVIDIFKVIEWISSIYPSQSQQLKLPTQTQDKAVQQKQLLPKESSSNNKTTKNTKKKQRQIDVETPSLQPPIEENAFYCRVYAGQRPHRKPSAKWYISKDEYKPATYPKFCSGAAYITSMKIVQKFHAHLQKDKKLKLMWVDDVFITGMLVDQFNAKAIRKNSKKPLNSSQSQQKNNTALNTNKDSGNDQFTISLFDRSEEYNFHHINKKDKGMKLVREWYRSSMNASPWTFILVEHGDRFAEDYYKIWIKMCSVHQHLCKQKELDTNTLRDKYIPLASQNHVHHLNQSSLKPKLKNTEFVPMN